MKRILAYYAAILLPIVFLALFIDNHNISSAQFVWLFLVYALVYRPAISGVHLIELHKIKRSEFLMNFIPMWNWKYSYFLFFGKK